MSPLKVKEQNGSYNPFVKFYNVKMSQAEVEISLGEQDLLKSPLQHGELSGEWDLCQSEKGIRNRYKTKLNFPKVDMEKSSL